MRALMVKPLRPVLLAALVLAAAAGCGLKQTSRILFDRSGREVRVKGPLNRIVSIAPSNTEIIADLGLADKLVGIDVHSVDVEGIPPGLTLVDFFYPNAEVLLGLEPDVIIAHGHNATGSGEDPLGVLREMGIPVAYISMSRSVNDIYDDIAFIADLLRVPERGEALIRATREQIEKTRRETSAVKTPRTVYFEIGAAPEMFTFGKDSFLNDMVSIIGAKNIFENDNWVLSPSAEAVIDRDPEVILTNVNYLEDPIGEIKGRPGFDHIRAVVHNRVYRIDTNSSVRPTARIVLALRQMARAVYPEVYEER
ncbi:MAG: ABC transporter substrate-binding protein [Treponema sp.]|jgi:iron complex transport system substrate-binding protein|nr:ABC transporter substrate-binding protein [Treponema sp.]